METKELNTEGVIELPDDTEAGKTEKTEAEEIASTEYTKEEAVSEEAKNEETEAEEAVPGDPGEEAEAAKEPEIEEAEVDPFGTDEETAEAVSEEETGTGDEKEIEDGNAEEKASSGVKRFAAAIKNGAGKAAEGAKALPWKRIGVIGGIVFGICAVIYLGGAWFYSNHFYYNTTLKGINCSNMTAAQAEEKIYSELDQYSFVIHERGGKDERINGNNIDFKCVSISGISEALEKQNPFAWPFDINTRQQEIELEVVFDADKLYREAETLGCFAESIKDMDGAYAGVYYQDRHYLMNEIEGKNVISFEKLYSALYSKIGCADREMTLEDEGIYVLMAEEDKLRHAIESMDQYVSTVVTYTRGSDTFELNGDTINAWISLEPDLTVNVNYQAVSDYIAALAGMYNTVGSERSFVTSSGQSITVRGGDYGWEINKAREAELLRTDLENGQVITREPALKRRERPTGITNTYVEVSIAAQTLWYYKDGALFLSTPVVTGNPLQGNGTHTGIYSIKYKEKDAVLRGDDYETPVRFWMPFNGGEGLHDATWRGRFGGGIYRGGGSHGCVNMPYNAAATLFANIESGTPVIVY